MQRPEFTRAEVENLIEGCLREQRDSWSGWVARAASEIAHDAEADPQRIFAVLDRLVSEHLDALSEIPLPL